MTQDQYGQARGPGYVVRGNVVPEDETEDTRTGEPKPMTRLKKVASALRGGSEADEQDQAAADEAAADQVSTDRTAADARAADAPADSESSPPWVTRQDEAAMAGSPISRESAAKRDYWDDADAAGHEDTVAATSPDTPADHQATEPDMFGTTRRTGEETAEMPAATAEAQPGAATIADVPAARTPVTETTASEIPAAEATGSTGRHAAATTAAEGELRPGEATANLGDFSDLTYGNLVPDAAHLPRSGSRSSSGSLMTRTAP